MLFVIFISTALIGKTGKENNKLNLHIESIMSGCLVNRQSHFIKSGYFQVMQTGVVLHVVVCEIGDDLLEHDVVLVLGGVPREIVSINYYFLIGGRLTALHVQSWIVRVVYKEIVVDVPF